MGPPQTGFLIFATVMAFIPLIGAWKIIQGLNSKERSSTDLADRVAASHGILLFVQWLYIGLYVVYIEPENIEAAIYLALALLFFIPTLLFIAGFYVRRRLSRDE